MKREFFGVGDFVFRTNYWIRMNLRRDGFFNKRYYLRPFLKQLINKFGDKELIGCEVGVWRGYNSKLILKNLNMGCLYLVDPYIADDDKAGCSKDKQRMNDNLCHWIQGVGNAHPHYMKSTDMDLSEDMFDFVYLDGCHKYDVLSEELRLFYPAVVSGGMLAGHDINQIQVAMAVVDFCKEMGLEYSFQDLDWWIWKPKKVKKVNDEVVVV